MRVLCLIILSLLFYGCSLPYLAHVTTGQLRILEKKEDIKTLISEKKLAVGKMKKLELVQEVREFAVQRLKLSGDGNYTEFVDLDRDYVAVNITVCPKDSLKPYTWWFPFVGSLGYLGFFNKEYALEVKKEFDEEGYDTYLRGVSAYSTLGWFDDPVFSTMLNYPDETLTNIIIHELAHATIYKKGHTDFNEGVATFIGNTGSVQFFSQKYGERSHQHLRALAAQHDDRIFSRFLREVRKHLEEFYQREMPVGEKIKLREAEFGKIKRDFGRMKPEFKTGAYLFFESLPLNNAVLAGFGQYYEDLDLFEKIWLGQKKDFSKTLHVFRKAQLQDDPLAYLRKY